MHYDGEKIYRPPQEADSVLLQVMRGCSYTGCTFCDMYRDTTFRVSPREEVWADIEELKSFKDHITRIFLLNGDALAIPSDYLLEILLQLKEDLPHLERVASYARVDTILSKGPEMMKKLKDAGLNLLYIGIESGSDRILKEVNKGQTKAEVIEACQMLEEVGIPYWALLMNGLGGAGTAEENASETANMMNQLHPAGIWVGSTTIMPNAPLKGQVELGRYTPMGEAERLEEYILLLEKLDVNCYFTSMHPTVSTPVSGYLPKEQQKLIQYLSSRVDAIDEDWLEERRHKLAGSGRM